MSNVQTAPSTANATGTKPAAPATPPAAASSSPKAKDAAPQVPPAAQAPSPSSKSETPVIHLGAHVKETHAVMPLGKLLVDLSWNGRFEARARLDGEHAAIGDSAEADRKSPGLSGLAASMELGGQDTEVTACILPEGVNKGQPWLAAGFRRWLATELLQKSGRTIRGLEPGHIRVRLLEGCTMEEIRLINLRENGPREQLAPADVAFALSDLLRQNPALKQVEIAKMLGKSEPYISQLKDIVEGLRPDLFKDWRASTTPLPKNTVATVAKLEKKEQEKAYKAAVDAAKPKEPTTDGSKWIDAAIARATALGVTFGAAQRVGLIEGGDADNGLEALTAENIRDIFKFKTGVSKLNKKTGKKEKKDIPEATINRLVKAFNKGFAEGMVEPETEEEEEDDTEGGDEE